MGIIFAIILGLILLVYGAESLIRGASQLAFSMGVPPLIVGLTVVAFGTSAPELAVSVDAAYTGQAAVGLGNIFGSNLVNILLVLGLSAAIQPLVVSPQLMRFDVPVLLLVTAISWVMAFDYRYERWNGLVLVGIMVMYSSMQIYMTLRRSKQQRSNDRAAATASAEQSSGIAAVELEPQKSMPLWMAVVACIAGLAMLVFGSRWLVSGAVDLATLLNVPESIIGLTIVAVGTSLPEIVTSCVAAMRGERDIAIGNVVGSNLFNLLVVLGISCSVAPNEIEVAQEFVRFDIPLMLLATLALVPMFLTGGIVSRREGIGMLICYIAYLVYVVYLCLVPAA